MKAAAKALGWKMDILTYDLTNLPTVETEAMAMVNMHPNFLVVNGGFPTALYAQALAAAKAAHIPAFDLLDQNPVGVNDIVWRMAGPNYQNTVGELMQDWVIADSNGKADEVFYGLPSLPSINQIEKSFVATAAKCTGCRVTTIPLSLQEQASGNIAPVVVAYVQAHPSVNYLVFGQAPFTTGLRQAMNSAGVGKNVKIVSYAAVQDTLASLKAGQDQMSVEEPAAGSMWYMADAMARYSEGVNVGPLSNVLLPIKVATPKTPPAALAALWPGPPNYQQQFEKLWKVG
jgi:Periplasmic binding protein domain